MTKFRVPCNYCKDVRISDLLSQLACRSLNSVDNPSSEFYCRCPQNTIPALRLCCLHPELPPDSIDESFTGASSVKHLPKNQNEYVIKGH
ncbi:hypothetical protein CUMW_163600 [Citrus unshiu]|nr:hypothetical protein CUMW_163600 [Citrus unshiu]